MYRYLQDGLDYLKYDLLRMSLPTPENFSFDKLTLKFKIHKESRGYWLEAVKYPGLIASGDNLKELRTATFDAVLTYFDVPRAYAQRIPDNFILNMENGKQLLPPHSIRASVATA